MKVTIGNKTFKATLDDNPAAAKLRAMLPLTLDMSELNGNEKHFPPIDAAPDRCHGPRDDPERRPDALGGRYAGALLQGFRTTYSYTRLGRIDDPEGLAAAVGSGSVTVTFEPE